MFSAVKGRWFYVSVFAGICYLGLDGGGFIHLFASKCSEVRGWTEPIVGSICQARIYLLGLVSTSHQTLAGRNSSRKRFSVQNALQNDSSGKLMDCAVYLPLSRLESSVRSHPQLAAYSVFALEDRSQNAKIRLRMCRICMTCIT